MSPKVSINLCCYNSEKYLRETLDSIVNQTFKDWELIVIDDGSSDSTGLLIREYQDKGYPIFYHYQNNSGLSNSRNKALELSKGKYIAFIDHDDLWVANKLKLQVQMLETNERIGLIHSNWVSFNAKGYQVTMFSRPQPCGMVFQNQLDDYSFGIPTVMIRREVLKELDHFFEPSLTICEEVDLFLRICLIWEVGYIHDVLARYRMHSKSLLVSKGDRYGIELEYIANKQKQLLGDKYHLYEKEIARLFARAAYQKAYYQMSIGDYSIARILIRPYLLSWPKLILAYYATYIPFKHFQLILKLFRRKFHVSS